MPDLIYEKFPKKHYATLTINRPERLNAAGRQLRLEWEEALQDFESDTEMRCAIVTGKGRAFCAGADLKSPPGQIVEGQDRAIAYPDVLTSIIDSPKPVIAAINGAAFAGGLGLVGAADIVVTVDDVQFSFSEVRIGVIPAVISVVCLPKLGTHHGMKLFLTGERFTGSQAVDMGFAHRAVTADELATAVQEEIDAINLGGPIAVQEAKKLVRRVSELSIEAGFAETGPWSRSLFESDEGQEGISAFREKRQPNWVK